MTLESMIELLGEYRDRFGGDTEVRLMTQESWPLEYVIRGVTSGEDINDFDDDETDEDADVSDDAVVYIVEGQQLGYGTKLAWETARTH